MYYSTSIRQYNLSTVVCQFSTKIKCFFRKVQKWQDSNQIDKNNHARNKLPKFCRYDYAQLIWSNMTSILDYVWKKKKIYLGTMQHLQPSKIITPERIEQFLRKTDKFYKKYEPPSDFLVLQPKSPFKIDKPLTVQEQRLTQSRVLIRQTDQLLTIVKMLWADNNEAPPLQLRIVDTIFYEQDQLSLYVYYEEPTQTLHRVFNKGGKKTHWIGERFMRRRTAVERDFKGTKAFNTEYSVVERKGKKMIKKLGKGAFDLKKQLQVAVLKYKQKYEPVVLRDSDFLAILHNPIYVNDKFKHLNNTLYIQRSSVDSMDIVQYHNIEYRRETFQGDWLYELAADFICHHSSNNHPQDYYIELESELKDINEYLYLHFIVFKIVIYVSMHHQTRIKSMTVTFLKDEKKRIAISTIRNLSMYRLQHNRLEYQKAQVFPITPPQVDYEFEETKQMGLCDSIGKSKLYQCANQVFAECNMRIHQGFQTFLKKKVDSIQNPTDIAFSEECFKKLNPNSALSLNEILNNPTARFKLIKEKYPERKLTHKKKKLSKEEILLSKYHQRKFTKQESENIAAAQNFKNYCSPIKRAVSRIMSANPTFPKSPNSLPELLFLTR